MAKLQKKKRFFFPFFPTCIFYGKASAEKSKGGRGGSELGLPLARQELLRCPFFADKILQIQLSQVLELKTIALLWISPM